MTTISTLLRSSAARFGGRDYIVTSERRLTFAETELQSRRLAKRLLKAGVGKGTRVGMVFPQGPDFVVAFLAITRIGALAVPLSTFFRASELRRAIRHADAHLLLASRGAEVLFESTWTELPSAPAADLFLDGAPYLRHIWICGGSDRAWAIDTPGFAQLDDEGAISDALFEAIESDVTPADAMVMVHTSGATSEPKAVVHTHGAQVRHSQAIVALHGVTGETRTFTTMPFFWVGGLTVILLSHLHAGATVITIERADPFLMLDLIEKTHPTRLIGWTLVERIMSEPALADRDLTWLLPLQIPSMLAPGRRHNSLGMTETSGPHTGVPYPENTDDLPDQLRGSFGPALAGIQHKIVNPETGSIVPEGQEGEICVRGYSVMDGLYKNERGDTFDADGWYYTGDLGFFRDRLLFFTGRRSEMIKTGGANVSPREVEAALESFPEVKAAFVVGVPNDERGEIVGAVVCPEPHCRLDVAALTERLRADLSSYKVPKRIVVVPYDDAPWLASGKISKPRIGKLLLSKADE
jgi:acyl-CoA synthetase (AMP-forming)/AMP-acid ligase II